MRITKTWNTVLLWGQIVDLLTIPIGWLLDINEVIVIDEPSYALLIVLTIFAIITFFRQSILTNSLNEITPIVSISKYGVVKSDLKLVKSDDLYVPSKQYAYVEFSNNPKNRSSAASSDNVYTKIFCFSENDFSFLYYGFSGMWFPFKHYLNLDDNQVKENGTTIIKSSGEASRLMVAQKYLKQDMVTIIESCIEYFESSPNGSNTDYYQTHFLPNEFKYYILIQLRGERLEEKLCF